MLNGGIKYGPSQTGLGSLYEEAEVASLVVWLLRLRASNAGGTGLLLSQRNNIPHVGRCSQIKKKIQRHHGGMTMRKGHVRIQQEAATCKPRREASGETNLPTP